MKILNRLMKFKCHRKTKIFKKTFQMIKKNNIIGESRDLKDFKKKF